MNINRIAQVIGNSAAYVFWISSALVIAVAIALFLSMDTVAFAPISIGFVAVALVLVGSIVTIVASAGILRSRGAF